MTIAFTNVAEWSPYTFQLPFGLVPAYLTGLAMHELIEGNPFLWDGFGGAFVYTVGELLTVFGFQSQAPRKLILGSERTLINSPFT